MGVLLMSTGKHQSRPSLLHTTQLKTGKKKKGKEKNNDKKEAKPLTSQTLPPPIPLPEPAKQEILEIPVQTTTGETAESPSLPLATPIKPTKPLSTSATLTPNGQRLKALLTQYNGQRVFDQIFAGDLKTVQFRQTGSMTCYVLSVFGSIFRHPNGREMLGSVNMTAQGDKLRVFFPNSAPVFISPQDIGRYVQSDNLGIQILEAAYLKIPKNAWDKPDIGTEHVMVSPHEFGESYVAIHKMFRRNGDHYRVQSDRNSPQEFEKVITRAWHYPDDRGLLTAFRGAHYYSAIPAGNDKVILLNPFNTASEIPITANELHKQGYILQGNFKNTRK